MKRGYENGELFFNTYMKWYLNQPEDIKQITQRLFAKRIIYISNSKKKIAAI